MKAGKMVSMLSISVMSIVVVLAMVMTRDNKWESFKSYHRCDLAKAEDLSHYRTKNYTHARKNARPWLCDTGVIYYR